jgi:polyisoprenoid-binding protein YceI
MKNPFLSLAFAFSAILLAHPARASEPGAFKAYPCNTALSTLTYTAKTGLATINGVSKAVACTVWVNPDTTAFRIRVGAAVRSFKSGIGLRDSHAMKAVKADSFPRVEYASTTAKAKDGKTGPYAVAGDLTFAGETHKVDTDVQPEIKDGKAFIRGKFPVSLGGFNVKPPAFLMSKVYDKVEMTYNLAFDLAGGK